MSSSPDFHEDADPADPADAPRLPGAPPPPPPDLDAMPRLPGAPSGGFAPPHLPDAAGPGPTLPSAGAPAAADAMPTLPGQGAPAQGPADSVTGAAPYLPAAERRAPEPAPAPVFDARAMVESQKHFNPKPAYGALPKATPESLEAARKLREEAARKRRRNRRIGWYVALVFLGVVAAGGYLAFRAYQDEQDGKTDGSVPDADAAETLEALDGSAPTTVPAVDPAFLNAVRTSRNRLGTIDAASAERALHPATAPVLGYQVVRFDNIADDAPFTQYDITYATDVDEYLGFARRSDTGQGELIVVDDTWYAVYRADEQPERFARSAASLDPSGDTLYSSVLEPIDFLPLATQPYTAPVQEQAATPGFDRRPTTNRVVLIDTDAFQANDPEGYERWIDSLVRGLDMDELIDPATRQTSSAEQRNDSLAERAVANLDEFRYTRDDGLAIVSLVISAEGDVLGAGLIIPSADLRLVYSLQQIGDEVPDFSTGDVWE